MFCIILNAFYGIISLQLPTFWVVVLMQTPASFKRKPTFQNFSIYLPITISTFRPCFTKYACIWQNKNILHVHCEELRDASMLKDIWPTWLVTLNCCLPRSHESTLLPLSYSYLAVLEVGIYLTMHKSRHSTCSL